MKASELRALSVEELTQKRDEFKEEHLRLRCNNALRQLQDVQMLKKRRRDIARINTILSEKQAQASTIS
jgi:large subunit ribosomal protein L29